MYESKSRPRAKIRRKKQFSSFFPKLLNTLIHVLLSSRVTKTSVECTSSPLLPNLFCFLSMLLVSFCLLASIFTQGMLVSVVAAQATAHRYSIRHIAASGRAQKVEKHEGIYYRTPPGS